MFHLFFLFLTIQNTSVYSQLRYDSFVHKHEGITVSPCYLKIEQMVLSKGNIMEPSIEKGAFYVFSYLNDKAAFVSIGISSDRNDTVPMSHTDFHEKLIFQEPSKHTSFDYREKYK